MQIRPLADRGILNAITTFTSTSTLNTSQALIANNRTGNAVDITGLAQDLRQNTSQNTYNPEQVLGEVLMQLPTNDRVALTQYLQSTSANSTRLTTPSDNSPFNDASLSNLGVLAKLNSSAFESSIFTNSANGSTNTTSANDDISLKFQNQFSSKAEDKQAFHSFMKEVYGNSYDVASAENLRQKTLSGDFSWLPKVEYTSNASLGGANGAFSAETNKIYINENIKGTDLAARTFVEEAGHKIDTMVNSSDAVGDEGEMFRRVLSNEALTANQISEIRSENDAGTINVNGREIQVEFWNPFKAIGNAVKSVAGAIGDGIKTVGNAVVSVVKTVANTAVDVVTDVGKGVIDFGKNLSQGNVVQAFSSLGNGVLDAGKSVLNGVDKIVFQVPQALVSGLLDSTQGIFNGITEVLPFGKQIRSVTDRVFDSGRTIIQAGFGIARDVFRAPIELTMDFVKDIGSSAALLFQGKFSEAAKQFGMSFVNAGVGAVGRVVDVAIRGLRAAADIVGMALGAPPSQKLSAEQETYVRKIYGDSVDYSQIRIRRGGITDTFGMAAHVVGNTVYMPERFFESDGSLTAKGLEVFGHEVGHVWQNQNGGGDYLHEALLAQLGAALSSGDRNAAYNWVGAMREGTAFKDMNPEQQASLGEDIGIALKSGDAVTASDFPDLSASEFKFLMDAWAQIKDGKGAP